MKRFQFLLLDAGPIIELCKLGIWDIFIQRCNVTITRTVAAEAKYASLEFEDIQIDLESAENQTLVKIVDVDIPVVKTFYDKFDLLYKAIIDPGEKETLAFLYNSSENWLVCAADKAVFRVIGLLGLGQQGISLEEVLEEIGFQRDMKPQYTKNFREKWTHIGQVDSIQDRGLL
ncbi:MAG: hypothetical protein ACYTBX_10220 [Planctomycetota bacterium]|jgi:hypothetical protein